jgi:hypothetical protein
MGLSTASMVKIGNRLKALEQEREAIARINADCQGYTWAEIEDGWAITTPDKHDVEFTHQTRSKSSWYQTNWTFQVKIHKPGTRFKPRHIKKKDVSISDDWKARLCPAKSKLVYGLVRCCHSLKYELDSMELDQ